MERRVVGAVAIAAIVRRGDGSVDDRAYEEARARRANPTLRASHGAVVAALIAMVISVLIVVSLSFAGTILPSDRPGLLFSGSIARWLVAWGIAEVVAFTWWRLKRRRTTAEIHSDLQEPTQHSRPQK